MPPAPRAGTVATMLKRADRNLIVGLDIGTSKVVALVGEVAPDGSIELLGLGSQPSRGLKKGVVVNIESTVQSIQRAVEEAELMAGCEIHSVFAGIAGSHVRSLNSHGVVGVRDKEVSHGDVEHVIDAAKAVAIPADQKILHVLPQEFLVDGQEGIRDPIGMSGVRLEAKVHIVTGADSAAQNIEKCIQRCGLEVDDVVLEQLASAFAVLTEDEKELGVCLVDIGGGTTDLAVFANGAIRHTAVIPIAGDQVTNDIAVSMRTPTQYAEDIKIRYACALSQLANPDESIEVPSVGERPARRLARQTLAEIVEPRYEELFGLVREELRRSGFEEVVAAGIVLTGGSAKMEGAIELAEEVFHVPVRLGIPQAVRGLSEVVRNPIYSTGVGLLLYARDNVLPAHRGRSLGGNAKSVFDRMSSWFQGNF
jgi:cell division protein FtsA